MAGLRKSIKASIALGVLSLIALVVSHLALTDIAGGEGDVSLEWSVLRVCFALVLFFIAAAILTLRRALKMIP